MTDPVRYQVSDGVATITLDRPDAMNALDTGTKVALRDRVLESGGDDSVRAVILTGAGRAFCVGQDLREHAVNLRDRPAQVWATVADHYAPIAYGLATMDKPVIAAINGVAAGAGASIAFACDFRIAADTAGINLAFTGVGLSCDTGCSWTLPRLVGTTTAVELLMSPRTVDAEEALALGMLHRVVPSAELTGTVAALAARLAAGPTLAYAAVKRSLAYAASHDLAEALAFEATQMRLTGDSADHHNAVTSFLAKHQPVFHAH
jgi:2-(1,2-epoxy-1,2-dihydrophenyl)acetyl-CoA isomerase